MTLFARCFLLVFCQLGVGGLLSLAVPPFHELERGFFKSSAGVFLSASLIGGGGSIYLLVTRPASGVGVPEAILWAVHLILFALYLWTLWGDLVILRARLYASALLTGLVALGLSGAALVGSRGLALELLSMLSTLVAAAALGGVTTGMLMGHWYLIDPGMEIEPFRRCFRFFVRAMVAEVGVLIAIAALLAVAPPTDAGGHLELFALRVVLGPFAALGIALMIQRVLAIPQTMAATGLFYIATLAVLVGEFLGRYFTFRTGMPL